MAKLVVIVSVDWEPDKGPWKWPRVGTDYGGILRGTPALCDLLDELLIPCTWFIESSYYSKRDLPSYNPELVKELVRRKQDEIGLHIHWRRTSADNSIFYETSDGGWINNQLSHGVQQLEALGSRPLAFRSGALLHVRDLPLMLNDNGFLVDSSTLWGRANRLRLDHRQIQRGFSFWRFGASLNRWFGPIPEPYFVDDSDVERRGNSVITEFPIAYNIIEVRRPLHRYCAWYMRWKAIASVRTQYLMLFFHIDELTLAASGPDAKTHADHAMLNHFRRHLTSFQHMGAQFLTCSTARTHWLNERCV